MHPIQCVRRSEQDPVKLRLHGDSLRIRLSAADVSTLTTSGEVVCALPFSNDKCLIYRVLIGKENLEAAFEAGAITVRIPKLAVQGWDKSKNATLWNGTAGKIRVLIEMDLPCRHT